jgi:hypothetical protein
MRLTIIPSDGFVAVNGLGFSGLDLSSFDSSIHAIQWYGEFGEMEIKNPITGKMIENREITSIEEFQGAINAWQTAKDIEDSFLNKTTEG